MTGDPVGLHAPGDDEQADRTAIGAVLVQYASGLDRREFELVRRCFHDDVRAEYSGTVLDPGVEAVMNHVEVLRAYVRSLHLIGNVEIEVDRDEASSVCRAVAYLVRTDEEAGDHLYMRALTYEDRWVRTLVGWRIIERRHIPDWSVELPVDLLR